MWRSEYQLFRFRGHYFIPDELNLSKISTIAEDKERFFVDEGVVHEVKDNGETQKNPFDYNRSMITHCNMLETVGRGASASVKRVVCPFAIKITSFANRDSRDMANNEIQLLKTLQHTNIITLLASMFVEGQIYQMLPYATGGTFETFNADKFGNIIVDAQLQDAFEQLKSGIAYLHRQYVLHRDIKPANALVFTENGTVIKVNDFGISKRLTSSTDRCITQVGTTQYMSYSRCVGEEYGFEADRWSIGVMILQAVQCGNYSTCPFCGCETPTSYFEFLQNLSTWKFPYPDGLGHVESSLMYTADQLMELAAPRSGSPSSVIQNEYAKNDIRRYFP